ncbi:GDSL-type esterase/lipase family protein [Congregibacter brevis]|uniref:GDSL-type esterase/lipase family protein n=1 Tax=Congregibacter brevis TaxID=3081201 RepID=A0ABZ0IF62_9GAMM|nr:GDSL-type esterase/lipase family protein [Congregibacter sp. IMCC45268]
MLKTWLIRLSVLLNVLTLAVITVGAINPTLLFSGMINRYMETMRTTRIGQFSSFPVSSEDVVFLGDSITHAGHWEEMFPGISTRNRGISADTTTHVIERLSQVTDGTPRAVFLKIGTNDLTHGPEDRDVSYQQYRQILETIREASPTTRLFVQSLLPRAVELREEVEAYNAEIQKIAGDMGATYIDLYDAFLAADGSITDELTYDELHLTGEGYLVWQAQLTPYVDSL